MVRGFVLFCSLALTCIAQGSPVVPKVARGLPEDTAAAIAAMTDLGYSAGNLYFRFADLSDDINGKVTRDLKVITQKLLTLGVSVEEVNRLKLEIQGADTAVNDLIAVCQNSLINYEGLTHRINDDLLNNQNNLRNDMTQLTQDTQALDALLAATEANIVLDVNLVRDDVLALARSQEGPEVAEIEASVSELSNVLGSRHVALKAGKAQFDTDHRVAEDALRRVILQIPPAARSR